MTPTPIAERSPSIRDRALAVTVGGASGERVLRVDTPPLQWGGKYSARPAAVLAGGSSVNHGSRLLALGIDVAPIWPVAKDDTGSIIARAADVAAETGGSRFHEELLFMNSPAASTSLSTIISSGAQRTIITETDPETMRSFRVHCCDGIGKILAPDRPAPDAVTVGSVHSDQAQEAGGFNGDTTRHVIDEFHRHGVPVFANFGRAQYRLGAAHWQSALDKLECFQLSLREMREFFEATGIATLADMLTWFRDRCTLVVTLGSLGAVAQRKHGETVTFAWPYDLKPLELKDTTGAGDAFFAALVAHALARPLRDDDALRAALDLARISGAYACTTIGGASHCPDRLTLEQFHAVHQPSTMTDSRRLEDAHPILTTLDRAR